MLPPCYSRIDYWQYFIIDFSNKIVLDIGSCFGSFKKSRQFKNSSETICLSKLFVTIDINRHVYPQINADTHRLPFHDSSIDMIIANNVIEHCVNAPQAVKEMHRVLKKGGVIYFTIPFLYPVHESPQDYIRYTEFGLRKLFQQFSSQEILIRGGWCSTVVNFIFQATHILDRIYIGWLVRLLLYPPAWIFVQLDRYDHSRAFTRVYFGKLVK